MDSEQIEKFANAAELNSRTPGEDVMLQGTMDDDLDKNDDKVNEDNNNIEGSLAIYITNSGNADVTFDGNKKATFGHGHAFGKSSALFI